jgi:alkylhydroperoxidase family enzyme
MEARIPPLEPPFVEDVQRLLERMMGGSGIEPLRLFRVVAHNTAILDKFRSTGSYLLNFGTLDPMEREIVIHRTCARCGSEYEWGVHATVYARRVGLSEDQIRATVRGIARDAVWSPRQAALVRLADELYETSTITDELWIDLQRTWTPAQLVELVALAGQYRMVCYFTNAFRIPLEGFAERFPRCDASSQ